MWGGLEKKILPQLVTALGGPGHSVTRRHIILHITEHKQTYACQYKKMRFSKKELNKDIQLLPTTFLALDHLQTTLIFSNFRKEVTKISLYESTDCRLFCKIADIFIQRSTIFSRNLEATSKFNAPEVLHYARSVLRTHECYTIHQIQSPARPDPRNSALLFYVKSIG